jgi:hypothetical protein
MSKPPNVEALAAEVLGRADEGDVLGEGHPLSETIWCHRDCQPFPRQALDRV